MVDKKTIELIILFIGIVVIASFSAFFNHESAYWIRETANNEIYLTYPHFEVNVVNHCPQNIMEDQFYEISMAIRNYGKYADTVELNVLPSIDDRIIDYEIYGKTGAVIAGGDTLSNKIKFRTYDNIGNFTMNVSYSCRSMIKPCDFWTIKGIYCNYEAVAGPINEKTGEEKTIWNLTKQEYITDKEEIDAPATYSLIWITIIVAIALVVIIIVIGLGDKILV